MPVRRKNRSASSWSPVDFSVLLLFVFLLESLFLWPGRGRGAGVGRGGKVHGWKEEEERREEEVRPIDTSMDEDEEEEEEEQPIGRSMDDRRRRKRSGQISMTLAALFQAVLDDEHPQRIVMHEPN